MKVVFLAGAEEDLRLIRRYVIKHFGAKAWEDTKAGCGSPSTRSPHFHAAARCLKNWRTWAWTSTASWFPA